MDISDLHKLTAIMFALSRAETVEEYASLRDTAYKNSLKEEPSIERTIFDDLRGIFGTKEEKPSEPARILEEDSQMDEKYWQGRMESF